MILQAEIINNTADGLLQLGAIGILVVLMGVAIYFISKYFSKQIESKDLEKTKLIEKLFEVSSEQIKSNKDVINLIDKVHQDLKNELQILKLKQ